MNKMAIIGDSSAYWSRELAGWTTPACG